MTNSMNNISADISMKSQKLEEVTSFSSTYKQPCAKMAPALQKSESRLPGNGSNGQTRHDLAVQHHQLCKQVQALQVSCHLHPPLRP